MHENGPRKRPRLSSQDAGPYVLKSIVDDLPLETDAGPGEVSVTCVEYWDNSLYVGTSASEILHLVGLPAENEDDRPTYILASRLQPSGYDAVPASGASGVQQILLLPEVLKACVLCNGTVSFYTLPELSPAHKETTGVQWIGGLDENANDNPQDGRVVMIALAKRIIQVRVGEKPRAVKPNIEYPGCLRSSRRGTIACVADEKSYALLEVEHQQKIPLFPISSVADQEEPSHHRPTTNRAENPGHSRSTSLFNPTSPPINQGTSPERSGLRPPEHNRRPSNSSPVEEGQSLPSNRPRSSTEGTTRDASQRRPSQIRERLMPHILSPFPDEFMLTTGTWKDEPAVAMFVNLDGDLVPRGTLEFDQYPEAVIANNFGQTDDGSASSDTDLGIVALLQKTKLEQRIRSLEIQSLSESNEERSPRKTWIDLPPDASANSRAGLHCCLSSQKYLFDALADLLQAVRYKPGRVNLPMLDKDPRTKASIEHVEQETALFENHSTTNSSPTLEYEQKRTAEEQNLVKRLCYAQTRAVVWSGNRIWQIFPNPLLLQLEHEMLQANVMKGDSYTFQNVKISRILSLLGRIREQEPRDEIEFRTLRYVRQKASVVLLLSLLSTLKTSSNLDASCKLVESTLHEGGLDPRIPLLLLTPLFGDVSQGPHGIWLEQGIVDCLVDFTSPVGDFDQTPLEFWLMVRHYLATWQEKRGYGSISDDQFVFDSVDAALLHLLLHLDSTSPADSGLQKSVANKLNNVVDNWKGNFEVAVSLLERYHRLYVLSRLHQSRKAYRDVLATWRRICEGERDDGRDVTIHGAQWQVRKYLPNRTDAALVREYGLWLAQQNSGLAVQVFADDTSRVKFAPSEVVLMLKEHAPDAVQLYLEHLVFSKHLDQYADDLVGYYLDSVLSVLEKSNEARQSLADSYSTYRAMAPPKPTYLDFIVQNTPEQEWWQSRLRLLQLLGSGGYATAEGTAKELTYSIDKVLDRLKPFSKYLVSESIILDARRGRHEEAMKLLVHGMGDYDTAIRYCYFGGPSSSSGTIDASLLPSKEVQKSHFHYLYGEFLKIEDLEERLDRTSHLLGTFATWFDPSHILDSVPQDWPLHVLADFFLRSFRAATSERNQALIVKALSAAQYLQKQAEFIEACEKIGARLESDGSTQQGPSDGVEMVLS